jgi:glycerol-3-phosphate cytidylyltransferase
MIYKPEMLSDIVNTQRENGRKTVFTNGCFDILHAGHVKYLKESKSLGDILIVGLNSDNSVKRLKGESRPINTLEDRATVIEALRSVDYVCAFDQDTPKELLEKIRPDILTKGGDYKKEDVVGFELLSSYGGEVRILSFIDGKSTTNIIERAK